MKTAVTVLQEMMVKLGQTPDYECIAQSGPQHLATFEYRCAALGAAVTAAARSKKEAKQEAARLMLRRLALLGHPVPPPYAAHDQSDNVSIATELNSPSTSAPRGPDEGPSGRKRPAPHAPPGPAGCKRPAPPGPARREASPVSPRVTPLRGLPSSALVDDGILSAKPFLVPTDAEEGAAASARGAGEAGGGGARSYVALLKELCEEYRLPGAEYELVGDTGPPHLRHFTVAARVGQFSRSATATTKKAARQIAADQLYSYLRENLARLTKDFVEEDALVRAHAKAMERFQEARDERLRPDLGQRVADYHLEPEAWDAALRALEAEHDGGLEGALAALGLQAEATTLEAAGAPLHVLTLDAAAPPLAFAGASPQRARAAAARYLRRALARRRPPATPELA
ncbi:uncharacterized protein LOC114364992 isoform X2 [Ostrinia furnacalis]|uniref:uncharacterized protein LOC114364992 isoform X2 n=1 Tax=Ostrinia furnacalis TaxID=93504 RepID=UPI00103D5011|nr:uncharacterized protein LOC114364992 isoform X2 [Ostrinia furnacalis]